MSKKAAAEAAPAEPVPVTAPNTTDIHPQENNTLPETPKPEEGVEPQRFNDAVRNEIYAKRQQRMMDEMGLSSGLSVQEQINEPTEPPAADAPSETDAAATPATEASAPASGEVMTAKADEPAAGGAPEPDKKYSIKVNGQTMECTLDELQQFAQLGVAGRQNLEEAARIRREAEAIAAAARQHSQPQPAANPQAQPQLPDIPKAELMDIAKRLNYGSEEEQAQAIHDAIALGARTGQPHGLTQEQLVNAATQNAIAVLSSQQEQVILASEFKDIVSDPVIAHATDLQAVQLAHKYAALGQQKTRIELLREAGQMVRSKYLRPAPSAQEQPNNPAQAPSTPPMREKLERKRAAPQPPAAANKVAAEAPSEQKYSPASIVAAMRATRHQPAIN